MPLISITLSLLKLLNFNFFFQKYTSVEHATHIVDIIPINFFKINRANHFN